ncbi:MAG: DUF134 domain-containing protein [Clostridia bacterium]
MPRPQKCRFVCGLPENAVFVPHCCNADNLIEVVMTVDEYEVIRLIDYVNYTQEECADKMKIARTTVQGIYDGARKKIADVLVNGKKLSISGGEYKVCEKLEGGCEECPYARCRKLEKVNKEDI